MVKLACKHNKIVIVKHSLKSTCCDSSPLFVCSPELASLVCVPFRHWNGTWALWAMSNCLCWIKCLIVLCMWMVWKHMITSPLWGRCFADYLYGLWYRSIVWRWYIAITRDIENIILLNPPQLIRLTILELHLTSMFLSGFIYLLVRSFFFQSNGSFGEKIWHHPFLTRCQCLCDFKNVFIVICLL